MHAPMAPPPPPPPPPPPHAFTFALRYSYQRRVQDFQFRSDLMLLVGDVGGGGGYCALLARYKMRSWVRTGAIIHYLSSISAAPQTPPPPLPPPPPPPPPLATPLPQAAALYCFYFRKCSLRSLIVHTIDRTSIYDRD